MAGCLNGGFDEDPIAVLHIGVFHERHAAEAGHRDGDDAGIILKLEQISPIANGAGRCFIRVQRLDVPNRSL